MLRGGMCLVVVVCSTLIGNWFALRLRSRRKSLLVIIDSIRKIKNHITFMGAEIYHILNEVFSDCENFQSFCRDHEGYDDFLHWWKKSVEGILSESGLNREDKKLLCSFGETLGVTDVDGQISNCDFYIDLFTQRLSAAETAEDKNSRLYKILGFSMGCIVTLVVL